MITLFAMHRDEAEIQVYEKGLEERALQRREVGRPAWNLTVEECASIIDGMSQTSPPLYGLRPFRRRCKIRSLHQLHLVVFGLI